MFKKLLSAFLIVFLLVSGNSVIFAEENETTPAHPIDTVGSDYSVVPCRKSERTVKSIGESSRISGRSGIFYPPGSTAYASSDYHITLSNSATFNVVPELLNFGYSTTYSAGGSNGWSLKNTTSRNLELVIKGLFIDFEVTDYQQTSPGMCKVTTFVRSVYKGWMYDLD